MTDLIRFFLASTRILKIASLEAELAQKTAELERLKQLRAENTELRRLLDQAPPFTVHPGSTTPVSYKCSSSVVPCC